MSNPQALDIRGTLYFCPVEPVRPCGKYVYQKVRAGLGNVPSDPHKALQLRRHVIPYDPHTPAQTARRARMASGVAAWHALGPDDKKAWRAAGASRRLPGFQTFISAWLKA